MTSRSMAMFCCTFWMSTTGTSPVTVIVSSTDPTASTPSTFAVKPALRLTPSRSTVEKPERVNVTVYSPETRPVIRYCPDPSGNAVRTCSIRAGLRASTATPGSTPPVSSVTVPPMACAFADDDASRRPATAARGDACETDRHGSLPPRVP